MFKQLTRIVPTVAFRTVTRSSTVVRPVAPKMLPYWVRNYASDRMGHNIDGKIDDISDREYNQLSNNYLEDLGDELDMISEDHDDLDFDLTQGVLTLNTKSGTYVIHRQPPNKQIWLSSPITGPNRYDLIDGQWKSLRDGGKLTDLLSHELSQTYNESIELQLEN